MEDSLSTCDLQYKVTHHLTIHIPKCIIKTSKVFYKLFNIGMLNDHVDLVIHEIVIISVPSSLVSDNFRFSHILMPFNLVLMKYCDLYAGNGIMCCARNGEYLNFGKISTSVIPPHASACILPPSSCFSYTINGSPTTLSWASSYSEDPTSYSFMPFYIDD